VWCSSYGAQIVIVWSRVKSLTPAVLLWHGLRLRPQSRRCYRESRSPHEQQSQQSLRVCMCVIIAQSLLQNGTDRGWWGTLGLGVHRGGGLLLHEEAGRRWPGPVAELKLQPL
jgi:hypothetical protein